MRTIYIALLAAGSAALMMTGCASSQENPEPAAPQPSEPTMVVPGATVTEDGSLIFSAEGQSIATMESPISIAKAKVAAATTAKANLLEVIKGALISSSTKVEDLMLVSQSAEKKVNGWLARATVEIVPLEEIVVEKTNLPQEPDIEPTEQVVTAIATLILSQEDLDALKPYVE